ncbi:ABC transporter aclQ [Physcia stellaris]|nr:ABC transporter aclQ [Physcia stellaris]
MASTHDTEPTTLWYFAYGSNMSSQKFTGSRGIVPYLAARVFLPGWVLTMEIPGFPYSEPAFSSIKPAGCLEAWSTQPDVIGVAYRITEHQYRQIIISEGGGTAYAEIEVEAKPLTVDDAAKTGERLKVRTLGSAMSRCPAARPSKRYMDIVESGAQEAQLPCSYRSYLNRIIVFQPSKQKRTLLGAMLFQAMWNPILAVQESFVKFMINPRTGSAPSWVVICFQGTMGAMWLTHDFIFAPAFGRGDGLMSEQQQQSSPQSPLNEKTFRIDMV